MHDQRRRTVFFFAALEVFFHEGFFFAATFLVALFLVDVLEAVFIRALFFVTGFLATFWLSSSWASSQQEYWASSVAASEKCRSGFEASLRPRSHPCS